MLLVIQVLWLLVIMPSIWAARPFSVEKQFFPVDCSRCGIPNNAKKSAKEKEMSKHCFRLTGRRSHRTNLTTDALYYALYISHIKTTDSDGAAKNSSSATMENREFTVSMMPATQYGAPRRRCFAVQLPEGLAANETDLFVFDADQLPLLNKDDGNGNSSRLSLAEQAEYTAAARAFTRLRVHDRRRDASWLQRLRNSIAESAIGHHVFRMAPPPLALPPGYPLRAFRMPAYQSSLIPDPTPMLWRMLNQSALARNPRALFLSTVMGNGSALCNATNNCMYVPPLTAAQRFDEFYGQDSNITGEYFSAATEAAWRQLAAHKRWWHALARLSMTVFGGNRTTINIEPPPLDTQQFFANVPLGGISSDMDREAALGAEYALKRQVARLRSALTTYLAAHVAWSMQTAAKLAHRELRRIVDTKDYFQTVKTLLRLETRCAAAHWTEAELSALNLDCAPLDEPRCFTAVQKIKTATQENLEIMKQLDEFALKNDAALAELNQRVLDYIRCDAFAPVAPYTVMGLIGSSMMLTQVGLQVLLMNRINKTGKKVHELLDLAFPGFVPAINATSTPQTLLLHDDD